MTWQDLANCLGLADTGRGLGSATSPTYVRGVGTQVTSTVEYETDSLAQQIVTALSGNKFQACAQAAYASAVGRDAPSGGQPGAVHVTPFDVPKQGQLTSASQAMFTLVMGGGLNIPIVQQFVIIVNGDAIIRMTFVSPVSPFPIDIQEPLIAHVVARA